MFAPSSFRLTTDQALTVASSIGFGALIANAEGTYFATHLPFLIQHNDDGTMIFGHCARANPHAGQLAGQASVLVVQGPHAYIPAGLYAATERARQSGTPSKDVPTWNYVAVHLHGITQIIDDAEGVVAILDQTIKHFEPDFLPDWHTLDTTVRTGLLKGIVGFSMRVTDVHGVAKWSQNRTLEDRQRVTDYLQGQGINLPPGLLP